MPSVEITVDEFMDSCSVWEMEEIVEEVVKNCSGNVRLEKSLSASIKTHFKESSQLRTFTMSGRGGNSYDYDEFKNSLNALLSSYYSLSNEDIEIINRLAKRFK